MLCPAGDSGDGWASIFEQFAEALPEPLQGRTRWIFPHAPRQPVSLNNGFEMPSWFDIMGLDAQAEEDTEGMAATAAMVERLVEDEVAAGVSPKHIFVGGFSQGGAVALQVALRSPRPLAGCIALSTWVHSAKDYPDKLGPYAKTIPFLQAHGDADMVVAPHWGHSSNELLSDMGIQSKFYVAPGVGHGADPGVMREVISFMREALLDSGLE